MVYEVFEHTADLGLRIRADDLAGLFEEAARALFSVIMDDLEEVRPIEEVTFALEAGSSDELMRDWLAELLYVFHANRLLLGEFHVDVEDTKLSAIARGEPIDLERHKIDIEIKAVTYHGLKLEHDHFGWLAEVIVDI
jgi:SHS2 domain-containing protein